MGEILQHVHIYVSGNKLHSLLYNSQYRNLDQTCICMWQSSRKLAMIKIQIFNSLRL